MNIDFERGRKLLDVGCGDGTDAQIFAEKYGLEVSGIDVYEHKNIKNIKNFKFRRAGILKIPFQNNSFEYVFLHDVLHHIDEQNQSYEKHVRSLKELKRVCKKQGNIIILEANRYNPLFYSHMTLIKGHNHFKQSYFVSLIKDIFSSTRFKFFECHLYPKQFIRCWKIHEKIMESISFLKPFRAYNLAIIRNDK